MSTLRRNHSGIFPGHPIVVAFIVPLLYSSVAFAEGIPPGAQQVVDKTGSGLDTGKGDSPPSPAKELFIQELRLTQSRKEETKQTAPGDLEVALDDVLIVKVNDLKALKGRFNKPGQDLSAVGLLIDGEFLKDIPNREFNGDNALSFHLKLTENNKETWRRLFRNPWSNERFYHVALGLQDGTVLATGTPTALARIHLALIGRAWQTFVFFLILAALWVVGIGIAWKTNLIRDTSSLPLQTRKIRPPYSLGKTQMFAWTLILTSGFIFVWWVTKNIPNFPPELLVLIGISSSTALGSVLVSKTKRTLTADDRSVLESEKKRIDETIPKLEQEIAQLSSQPQDARVQKDLDADKTNLDYLQDRRSSINNQLITDVPEGLFTKSACFFSDILTDGDGVSLHRFQIVVWTVVLMAIFVRNVFINLEMPTFSESLLTLMGISAGTYIGFKFPEKNT